MIQKSKTSELANKPKGKKVTRVKWVYKTKPNADNSIKKNTSLGLQLKDMLRFLVLITLISFLLLLD